MAAIRGGSRTVATTGIAARATPTAVATRAGEYPQPAERADDPVSGSARSCSRCRETASERGCGPAQPDCDPVPATQATLLIRPAGVSHPDIVPMTRQGARPLTGARLERGVMRPGDVSPAQAVTIALLNVHAPINERTPVLGLITC